MSNKSFALSRRPWDTIMSTWQETADGSGSGLPTCAPAKPAHFNTDLDRHRHTEERLANVAGATIVSGFRGISFWFLLLVYWEGSLGACKTTGTCRNRFISPFFTRWGGFWCLTWTELVSPSVRHISFSCKAVFLERSMFITLWNEMCYVRWPFVSLQFLGFFSHVIFQYLDRVHASLVHVRLVGGLYVLGSWHEGCHSSRPGTLVGRS